MRQKWVFHQKNHSLDKKWLADFTLQHPDIFAEFKAETIKRISAVDNRELEDALLSDITGFLIEKIRSISPGNTSANEYHRLVVGVFELLFYPNLGNPQIEREIHDGRKRIDITFDNCADDGFFYRLGNDIPCRFIMVECKNYSRDIANPELDQLSGRFSPRRGQFGIAACRSIENMELFLSRCADTWNDSRGLIIPIVDDDLVHLLTLFPTRGTAAGEALLQDRYRQIALR